MGSPLEAVEMDPEMGRIRRNMFKSAMRGEWVEVVQTYRDDPRAFTAKITKAGDTALHLAVRDSQENVVEELVSIMCNRSIDEAKAALKIGNDRKNTALHIAAAVGNVPMCNAIAKVDPPMVGERNVDQETPFFLAALHGKTDAFLCLHAICGPKLGLSYSRRGDDGDTVLHVAIIGEFFDLAFQIIYLYDDLVNSFNARAATPLHILATKPNVFRSGTYLAGYQKLIYNFIFIDELKVAELPDEPLAVKASNNNEKTVYPQNYETCVNLFRLPGKVYAFAKTWYRHSNNLPVDTENQQGSDPSKSGAPRTRLIPSNYDTCFDIIKFVSKAILIILGLGSSEIKKLQEKKEKHTWSVQIMEELIRRVRLYEYEHTGKSPNVPHPDEVPYAIGEGGEVKENAELWDKNTTQHTSSDNKDAKSLKLISPEKHLRAPMVDKIIEYCPSLGDKNLDRNDIVIMATEKPKATKRAVEESPTLLAAMNGITEMVENILENFPVAIHDMNLEKKNIVLLAVENRQPLVYKLLLKRKVMRDSIFRQVDKEGNSALHLAATLGSHKPWRIPGAALQMEWEIKWYEYVKNSMPRHFFARYNNNNQTAKDIFTDTHQELVKNGGEWLTHTSESCSVVAALIATVAFATSATVPGGVKQDSGTPTLEKQPPFNAFAISSLVALCFSVTAVVMFLAILTSRYEEKDFGVVLPRRLLVGMSSLFVSIGAILVSFCAGHFFMLRDELKVAAFPVYAVTCLPVTLFAIAQFPLYVDLAWATFKKVPQRSYMVAL